MLKRFPSVLLGIAVVLAPVMVGSVHTLTAGVLCALVVLAAWINLGANLGANLDEGQVDEGQVDKTKGRSGSWLSLVFAVFALFACWTALQLVPLPLGLLEVVQPAGAAAWAQGWELATGGQSVPWRPISLDPAATADRGLRWVTLALATWVAANLPSSRRWRIVSITVLAAGAVALLVGGWVRATDATTLFGLYEPSIGFRGPSPFVSTNHAASFYGACGLVGLGGLALRREGSPIEASIAGVLGLVFLALAAVHDSDAVMASLGVAVVIFVAGFATRTERGQNVKEAVSDQLGRVLYVSVAGACLLLLGWWLGLFDLLSGVFLSPLEGSESALNRSEIMAAAIQASRDYAWVGSGGGAVDVVVGSYVDWTSLRPASIPVVENDPIEWLLTYGWVVGGFAIVLLLGAMGLVGRRLMSRNRGERWLVGAALLVYGAGISMFHFPFLALGVSLPLAVAVAGMIAPRRAPQKPGFEKSGHLGVGRGATIAVLVALTALGGFHAATATSRSFTMEGTAEEIVTARPTDGRVYAELANRALDAGEIDRARALARHSAKLDVAPDARIFLARILGTTGADAESAAIYADLLKSPVESRLVRFSWLVQDLERSEDRALALRHAHGEQLQRAIKTITKMEGAAAATDVVIELADVRGDDPAFHRAAVRTFIQLGTLDLAEMWADSVTQRGLEEEGRPVGIELSLEVALAARREDEARRIAAVALGDEDPSPVIARVYLSRLPELDVASTEEGEMVRRAHDIVCQSPIPKKLRDPCWIAEAWMAERAGEFEDAELIYRRIASRLNAPYHLAHFLVRRGECLELQRFKEELDDERVQERIGRIAGECRSGSEKLTPRKGR